MFATQYGPLNYTLLNVENPKEALIILRASHVVKTASARHEENQNKHDKANDDKVLCTIINSLP